MELSKEKKMLIIKVRYHYFKDDTGCAGDYTSIDIYLDNQLKKSYGDHYHDKGQEKIEGVLDCLDFLGVEHTVIRENINDY